jgi:hypothetical protein
VALHHRDFSVSLSLVRRNYTDMLRLRNPRSDKFGRLVLEWGF